MPIRISKVIKDLNVGLDTIVEFLSSKGENVEQNPNAKITDEQYELLVEEFDTDKKLKKEAERQSQERLEKKEKEAAEKAAEAARKAKEAEEIVTKIDESKLPKFKQVGKIDLDGKKNKEAAEPKAEPKEKTPAADNA